MANISVKKVGKAYKQYPSRFSRLKEWLWPARQRHSLTWILQDIDFNVSAGEAVGIIGINGAGKSTLLKMITGTTLSTVGDISISGRVAALLELGMGFHPDFTGRQNVYMSGQLMGMTNQEIADLMPEIEAFAEIGNYIDQPVRIYSSGMQVRLAFSVATAIRPDVLIVDEALSVGDIKFQQKCYRLIETFKQKGTILLFVTHDLDVLYKLCDRAILINAGAIAAIGTPKDVSHKYELILKEIKKENPENLLENIESVSCVNISSQLENENGEVSNILNEGEHFSIRVNVIGISEYKDPHIGFQIRNRLGMIMYETNTYCLKCDTNFRKNTDEIEVLFYMQNNLGIGEYVISFGMSDSGFGDGLFKTNIITGTSPIQFQVVKSGDNKWFGHTNMFCKVEMG